MRKYEALLYSHHHTSRESFNICALCNYKNYAYLANQGNKICWAPEARYEVDQKTNGASDPSNRLTNLPVNSWLSPSKVKIYDLLGRRVSSPSSIEDAKKQQLRRRTRASCGESVLEPPASSMPQFFSDQPLTIEEEAVYSGLKQDPRIEEQNLIGPDDRDEELEPVGGGRGMRIFKRSRTGAAVERRDGEEILSPNDVDEDSEVEPASLKYLKKDKMASGRGEEGGVGRERRSSSDTDILD